ncbi:MAG TPA: hypothetical protein VNJ54_03210 [Plantibacter sp.]|uniref:hypothetical protein n=1 Tax=Plantibacter sp. TaxID=1871045 RepID=UPI002BA7347C|nr:hypothetical protein [Plantibacter sp.]
MTDPADQNPQQPEGQGQQPPAQPQNPQQNPQQQGWQGSGPQQTGSGQQGSPYGQSPTQSSGQYGQQPGPYSQQTGQQPSYGQTGQQPTGQYGQSSPDQQPTEQFGSQSGGQYGQQSGQYSQQTGQQPSYGQEPTGQYGQQPSYGQQPTDQYGQAPTAAYGQQPYGQAAGGYATTQQQPPKKKLSKKGLTGIIAGGSALLLIIVGGIVGVSVGNALHAPEVTVKSYLDALKAGNAEQALKLSGTEVSSADVLLTDEAYDAASGKVSGYTIGKTTTSGDTATVQARLTQGGESVDQEFTLTKVGKDAVLFDKWKLEAPELSTVQVDVVAPSDAVATVGGVELTDVEPIAEGSYQLRALPGTYDVALSESDWYAAEATTATAQGFGQTAEAATLAVTLTDAGTTAVEEAVNAYIDGCGAATDLAPEGCPFEIRNDTGYTPSGVAWKFDTRPTFTIGEFSGSGWSVDSETVGRMSMTCTLTDPATGQTGPGYSITPVDFIVGGTIDGFTDDGATFVPLS